VPTSLPASARNVPVPASRPGSRAGNVAPKSAPSPWARFAGRPWTYVGAPGVRPSLPGRSPSRHASAAGRAAENGLVTGSVVADRPRTVRIAGQRRRRCRPDREHREQIQVENRGRGKGHGRLRLAGPAEYRGLRLTPAHDHCTLRLAEARRGKDWSPDRTAVSMLPGSRTAHHPRCLWRVTRYSGNVASALDQSIAPGAVSLGTEART
jgi:hypothetical protein